MEIMTSACMDNIVEGVHGRLVEMFSQNSSVRAVYQALQRTAKDQDMAGVLRAVQCVWYEREITAGIK